VQQGVSSERTSVNNPWWPYPCDGRSSSLEVHSHRLSVDFGSEDGDTHTVTPPVSQLLKKQNAPTRHLSVDHLYKKETQMPVQPATERRRAKQPRAKVEVHKPTTRPKVQGTQRQSARAKDKKATVYESFNEDCFGKRIKLSPKPVERKKSLLSAELKHEEDADANELARMSFWLPANRTLRNTPK
jgi:hypothetical protein